MVQGMSRETRVRLDAFGAALEEAALGVAAIVAAAIAVTGGTFGFAQALHIIALDSLSYSTAVLGYLESCARVEQLEVALDKHSSIGARVELSRRVVGNGSAVCTGWTKRGLFGDKVVGRG